MTSERKHYRTVVISDVHLGNRHAKVLELTDFLSSIDCDRLILNGDIIDGWQLRKSGDTKWRPEYTRIFKIIMKMMENNGMEVIYVMGNHDDFLANVVPISFSGVSVVRDYILDSGGHKYFVTHGDIFDNVSTNMKWLAKLGDVGYHILLWSNQFYNRYRAWRGKPSYSFSQAIKNKVKNAVSSVSGFETMVSDMARAKKCDGVICGHIHRPEDRMIGDIRYLNSGDWVETMSALVEDYAGNWNIMRMASSETGLNV